MISINRKKNKLFHVILNKDNSIQLNIKNKDLGRLKIVVYSPKYCEMIIDKKTRKLIFTSYNLLLDDEEGDSTKKVLDIDSKLRQEIISKYHNMLKKEKRQQYLDDLEKIEKHINNKYNNFTIDDSKDEEEVRKK